MNTVVARAARRLPVLLPLTLGACATPTAEAPISFPEPARMSVAAAPGATRLQAVATYFGGRIPVFVAPSAAPQVLHLSSNQAGQWHVYLMPGANVTAIYAAGRDPQRVTVSSARQDGSERPPRIADLGRRYFLHGRLNDAAPLRLGTDQEAAYRAELREATGLELTDFQGNPQVRPGDAFMLGGAVDEPRLRTLFPDAFRRRSRPATGDFARIARDLRMLIARGDLPATLPFFSNQMGMDEDNVPTWPVLPQVPATLAEPSRPSECGEVQLATAGGDALACDWGINRIPFSIARTRWLVAGGGNDLIVDFEGKNQMLSGGRGDDIINADLGNDVIHFGRNWGDDVLVLRCNTQRREWEENMPYNPSYRTSRYVVFGRGIRPMDLEWTGPNEIRHRPSGSRITFYDWPCAHFLAVEPGVVPPAPGAELTERFRKAHLARRRSAEAPPPVRSPPRPRD